MTIGFGPDAGLEGLMSQFDGPVDIALCSDMAALEISAFDHAPKWLALSYRAKGWPVAGFSIGILSRSVQPVGALSDMRTYIRSVIAVLSFLLSPIDP